MKIKELIKTLLVIAAVVTLVGCSNNDENANIDNSNNTEIVQSDVEITNKNYNNLYKCTEARLLNAIESVPGISEYFNTASSSHKLLQYMEGYYIYNNQYSVDCTLKPDTKLLSEGFGLNVTVYYSHATDYPNSISITAEFNNDADAVTAANIADLVVKALTNQNIATAMNGLDYNDQSKEIGEIGGYKVTGFRGLEDLSKSLGKYVLTYTMSIVGLDSPDISLKTFTDTRNKQYLLYNTVLLADGQSLERSADVIQGMFSESEDITILFATDSSKTYDESNNKQASLSAYVYNGDNSGTFTISCSDDNGANNLSISAETLNYMSKDKAIDAANKIIYGMTKAEFDLSELQNADEYSFEIIKSGLNTNWGYPLNVNITKSGDDMEFRYKIEINSIADQGK